MLSVVRKPDGTSLNGYEGAAIQQQQPQPPRRPVAHNGGNRMFYKESARVKSFARWPVPFLSPDRMAAAGFYYMQYEDAVRCPFCNIEVGRWERGDDPMVDHGRWAPNCRFVRGIETRNVPLVDCSSSDEEGGRDVCGTGIMEPKPPPVPDPLELEQNFIPKRPVSHPEFASHDARMKSFSAWPKFMKLRPNQLSDAGFYYTGTGDQTICFHCDGGLKDWEETDDPWVEHAKNFSKCEYLLTTKGREFVEKARNFQKNSQSTEQPGSSASCSPAGISSTSSQPGSSDRKEESRLCKICYTDEMGAAFYPCGHVVACTKCASTLTVCAVCRNPVKGTFRVFIS